jgi:hypothetical protein
VTSEPWCRACGASANWGDSRCGRCGVPLEPPDPGAPRVGQVISVKGKMMLRRNGIALQEGGGLVRVLIKGDETVDMPVAEFDLAGPVDVPGPRVGGAAGRLWRAQRASQAFDAKWNSGTVMSTAQLHATASMGARRAAALDAMVLGAHDLLPALGLTQGEIAWYRAWVAAGAGDTATTLGWLERLPAHGYRPRVTLLLSRAADLLKDAVLGARAVAQLAAFAAADLDARALYAVLARPGTADLIGPLVAFAVATEGADGRLAEWASAITATARPALPFPGGLLVASALDCYLRFRDGAECTAKVDVLRWLPVPLLDEMIDKGAVPRELAGQPGWPAGSRAYVVSRLAPGEAGLDDLAAAGFTAELARRHYLSGDTAALDALPAGNEAVRHYRALAAWQSGAGQPSLDGLRPGARRVLGEVAAARAAVRAGEGAALTETVAADSTCWPLLWQSALQGALRLPGPLAGQYPRFAEWLALCGIQRLLFQSRFQDALAAGRALAARTGLEMTSDEALNMVAFAHFQLGQPGSALQTLDEAREPGIGGRPSLPGENHQRRAGRGSALRCDRAGSRALAAGRDVAGVPRRAPYASPRGAGPAPVRRAPQDAARPRLRAGQGVAGRITDRALGQPCAGCLGSVPAGLGAAQAGRFPAGPPRRRAGARRRGEVAFAAPLGRARAAEVLHGPG